MRNRIAWMVLALLPLLHGCVAAVGGAVAGGAALAVDRRTVGTVTEDQGIELKVEERISQKIPADKLHLNVTSFNRIRIDGPYQVVLKTNVAPFARATVAAGGADSLARSLLYLKLENEAVDATVALRLAEAGFRVAPSIGRRSRDPRRSDASRAQPPAPSPGGRRSSAPKPP